jgi:MFS superfamily sulfate permease-like transporter
LAGVIVAIIALPLSIALAIASGVGPEQGIYTAIVAGFLISFFGGSRVQIAGPTAAFATIVAGIIAKKGMDGLVLATIIAGLILVLMGLFRLGGLIKFIPYTITTGFTAGIAVTIAIGQIKDFMGLTFPEGTVTIETVDKVKAIVKNITTVNYQSIIVGVVCLAILIVWPFVTEKIIEDNIIGALKYSACGTYVKCIDTIIRSNDAETVDSTLDRSTLYRAQTPQSFDITLLDKYYSELTDEQKSSLTDTCSIFTAKGEKIHIVEGDAINIKITTDSELSIAKLLASRV